MKNKTFPFKLEEIDTKTSQPSQPETDQQQYFTLQSPEHIASLTQSAP